MRFPGPYIPFIFLNLRLLCLLSCFVYIHWSVRILCVFLVGESCWVRISVQRYLLPGLFFAYDKAQSRWERWRLVVHIGHFVQVRKYYPSHLHWLTLYRFLPSIQPADIWTLQSGRVSVLYSCLLRRMMWSEIDVVCEYSLGLLELEGSALMAIFS